MMNAYSQVTLMSWKHSEFFQNITSWIRANKKPCLCISGTFLGFLLWKWLRRKEEPPKNFDELRKKIEELQKEIEKPQKTFEESQKEFEELQKEIEELREKNEELQKEIGRRKAQYKLVWRVAPLYADWRKEAFDTVNVTLDAATAHPALSLSEDGRQVIWQEIQQDLPSSTQRFDSLPCVLGQQGLSMGRHYWEVKVGGTHSWDLGICRDNATRKGRVTISPQNGFWAIRLYDGEYWALTSPETHLTLREIPVVVGIFLDYEDGDISFYNMTDGSHIFSFPKSAFYGVLRPFFRLWSSDSSPITICVSEKK